MHWRTWRQHSIYVPILYIISCKILSSALCMVWMGEEFNVKHLSLCILYIFPFTTKLISFMWSGCKKGEDSDPSTLHPRHCIGRLFWDPASRNAPVVTGGHTWQPSVRASLTCVNICCILTARRAALARSQPGRGQGAGCETDYCCCSPPPDTSAPVRSIHWHSWIYNCNANTPGRGVYCSELL